MSSHPPTKLKLIAAWTVVALSGAAVGGWNSHRREAALLRGLVDDARRIAVAFDPAELQRLQGTRDDAGTPTYAAVRERLRKLARVDAEVRAIHLYRFKPEAGKVVLLADSAPEAAPGRLQSGDEAPRAASAAALQRILRTGQPSTDGPLRDQDQTWLTTYALVSQTAAAGGGTAMDIVGVEVDAAGWTRELWRAGLEGAFYVWILLGLPLAAFMVMRRQHEQREVIRNLSEAMEQSHSAILIVDLESRIEYANRGLCQQIGYSRRELIGRKWREFQVPQAADAMLTDLVATVRSGRSWEGEWLNRRRDGSVYPVRGVVTPVKHRSGSLACFIAVFDDVTETKGREAELREARDAAMAGDRAKGQFLATMSHEVRTPLNGIVGFTSLLLDTPLTSEQREYVQTIRVSTEALIQLTGDILDFARIESGKLKLDPLACDPRECVEDALDLLAAKAAEKKIELLHRVGPDVPAAVVTDGARLRQIVVNLVGNAVKFTDAGEILVDVRRLPADSVNGSPEPGGPPSRASRVDSCLLEFSVHDTGIGIAPEHHTKLFRPFTQVDDSSTRRFGGTGLGLAICRNLVELMGGTIRVRSEPGRGSTFSFTIRAPIAAPLAPARDLEGMRLGLAVTSPALRRELAELIREWRGVVTEVNAPGQLAAHDWEIALIEVSTDAGRDLVGRAPAPDLPAEKCLGLVPISLPNDVRTALRAHFRLLVNKPVHHEALFALLSGSRSSMPPMQPTTHFGFRVLVVEDNVVNQRLIQRVLANLGCTPILVETAGKALAELSSHAADFDLVLVDLQPPETDGLIALRDIRSGLAGVRAQTMWIIALAADPSEQVRLRSMEPGVNDYLTMPLALPAVEAAFKKFRTDRLARKR